jgi:thiol-disulfide isomerase/thioredoxin
MTLLTPSLSFTICQFRNKIKINGHVVPHKFISTGRLHMNSSENDTNNNANDNDDNDDNNENEQRRSVTGTIYKVDSDDCTHHPTVQLYTKEGCTLCDKTKDVLQLLRNEQPHSLEAIDITDPDKKDIFDKYKWDIPVLHINGLYWTKHRLAADEATKALEDARDGNFEVQRGEPDAGAMERKMEERKQNS